MEHDDRRRWVREISAINERKNKEEDEERAQSLLAAGR
jgi:hypothetical protein